MNNALRSVFLVTRIYVSAVTAMGLLPARAGQETTAPHAAPTAPLDPAKQKMVFLSEYINFAWGFQHRGWYIDSKGDIYQFRYSGTKPYRFALPPTRIGHVPSGVFADKIKLIEPASHGKMVLKTTGADMGERSFTAYLTNGKSGKYQAVKLSRQGDQSGENDSPQAHALTAWLQSMAPR